MHDIAAGMTCIGSISLALTTIVTKELSLSERHIYIMDSDIHIYNSCTYIASHADGTAIT